MNDSQGQDQELMLQVSRKYIQARVTRRWIQLCEHICENFDEYIRVIRCERSSMKVVEIVLSMSDFYENDLRPGTNLICKAKSKLD